MNSLIKYKFGRNKKENIIDDNDINSAWEWINREFPFQGYIRSERKDSYFVMPKAVMRYIKKGSELLDFGAGPCDKTAILAIMGYKVVAFDDLQDDWHQYKDNKDKILKFASKAGIDYVVKCDKNAFNFNRKRFDGIILNNVIEHLNCSPRHLVNNLLPYLKSNGVLFIDVPNAVNLRKRIDVVRGRTNYPSFQGFYWSDNPWRGHIREYVYDDLVKMSQFLGLEMLELRSHHYHLELLGKIKRNIFKLICKGFPSMRESWLLICRKPDDWKQRNTPSARELMEVYQKQYYQYIANDQNKDNE